MIVASVSEFRNGLEIYYISSKEPLKVMSIEREFIPNKTLSEKSMEIFNQFNERDDEQDLFDGFNVIVMSEKEHNFFEQILPKATITTIEDVPTHELLSHWIRFRFGIDKNMIVGNSEGFYHNNTLVPLKLRFSSPRDIIHLKLVYYKDDVVDEEKLAREWNEKGKHFKEICDRCEYTYKYFKGETLVVLNEEQKDVFKKVLPNATVMVINNIPKCLQMACWLHNRSVTDMLASVCLQNGPTITLARQTKPDKPIPPFEIPEMHCFRRMRRHFTEFGAKTVYVTDNEDFFKNTCRLPVTKINLDKDFVTPEEYKFFKDIQKL